MEWSQIASDFYVDGSLRDIYILDTTIDDWARVYEILTADPDSVTFRLNGEVRPPPVDINEVFRLRDTCAPLLTYFLGKQSINCHFFTPEEIEFDLDPKDVDGVEEAASIAAFMARIGCSVTKEVRLTAENAVESVIARYDPVVDATIWMSASN